VATQTLATTQARWGGNHLSAGLIAQYATCLVVALIVCVPLIVTLFGGFKETGELMANPFGLPNPPNFDAYVDILTGGEFFMQMGNSLIVLVGSVAVSLLASAMAAFVFARLSFRGRDALFTFINLGLLFPLAVAILPLYIQLRNMGLLDSLPGVFLPQAAFSLPANILILRNFFRGVPAELEDAAYIDGCSTAGFFWRILLPLARPALATVAVLVMVASWNNFLLPLLVLNNQSLWTLPMGVMKFSGEHGVDWGPILAFVTLALIPPIVFYLLAQRQLIAGLTSGAIKG
jgi:raffinose/stachyose/melibiose transport system permease protein